ncbi:5'-nucleotidase, lipoprotein e(P4) family [Mucilaginibacter sp. X5P1]|uniref:5'-nucleotidase, lipoprotein e(P4) family n=1 Tax=Mucilaginibacter sp. X5P1 TaxID=2723088 RepID=UPI0016229598|nr:HAD family acid phosphatase [Mucilaginibacter sp. X5P1]MBB6137618.1 5'-nucleotidase (lipoprotein e(P4) family) [Mucilaginibacter sp. X5P1]
MKKLLTVAGVVIVASLLLALRSAKLTIEKKNADQESLLALLYQQKAGEYRALCLQAYNLARYRIDSIAAIYKGAKPMAIVTDLDETALDNSAGDAYAYQQDTTYNPNQWDLTGHPDAVPGAKDFFKYAAGTKKFNIYYVSNRPALPPILDATSKQMGDLGFPVSATEHCFFRFLPAAQVGSSKQPRRDDISKTDSIILLLGDNLIDIDSTFDKINKKYLSSTERQQRVTNNAAKWGRQWIILPNACYGDWEAALYNNAPNPTLGLKDTLREQQLKVYDYLHPVH